MLKRILTVNDPDDLLVLKRVSDDATAQDDVVGIAQDLIHTLNHTDIGVGLAAPQIGVSKRIIAINRKEIKNLVMVNPVIVSAVGRMKYDEGCLSVPGLLKRRVRKQFIKVKFFDVNFNEQEETFSGVDAIIIQHEINHLDGKTILDA